MDTNVDRMILVYSDVGSIDRTLSEMLRFISGRLCIYRRTRYEIEFIASVTVTGSFTDEIVYLSGKELWRFYVAKMMRMENRAHEQSKYIYISRNL